MGTVKFKTVLIRENFVEKKILTLFVFDGQLLASPKYIAMGLSPLRL